MKDRVLYIEDFHKPDNKVFDLLKQGYTVYNAPRPLLGHEHWQGDFRHGIFYAAVAPDDLDKYGDAPEFHKRNKENNGHPCEIVTRQTIMEYGTQVAKKYRIDLAEFEYEDIVQSYLGTLD